MPPETRRRASLSTQTPLDDDLTNVMLSSGNGPLKAPKEQKTVESPVKHKVTDLVEVKRAMPADCWTIRPARAWLSFAQAWIQTAFSYWVLYQTESWFLLPFAWAFAGTCAVALFVVGHEAAHGSFSHNNLLSEIAGTICLSPMGWPYHAWRYSHNKHHAFTNQFGKDTVWEPLTREFLWKVSSAMRTVLYYLYVGPLFFESSIAHHLMHYKMIFNTRITASNRIAILRSSTISIVTVALICIELKSRGGWFAIVKYWVMPYVVFNFWLSTYTYFHHKSPDMGWKPAAQWNKAQAQLYGTAHVDYSAIIEFLHMDINWHIPHHVSTKIPWYNLRRATYALLREYGNDIHTYEMNWEFWNQVTQKCHVYDEEKIYLSIDEAMALKGQ
eukprot:TRINITY_DN16769_c0_g1_i1.p1 TRINITY_DN16769_c0_g1~~TRINITY_DN16769_c0_g1_i1.p1  ORF type:complete len:416 (+),score=53.99 TRINITY_DN16769_c0_g1_i1:93-1250(+)